MAEQLWSYSVLRDDVAVKLVVAGAAGAVPAAMLAPVSWRLTMAGADEGPAAVLFFLPVFLLAAWAAAWWAAAARRVARLRRLARVGVPVRATVRRVRLLRGKVGVAGVVVWLEYEVNGETFQVKQRTTLPGVAGRARENGPLELVIDPAAPVVAALTVSGRLG